VQQLWTPFRRAASAARRALVGALTSLRSPRGETVWGAVWGPGGGMSRSLRVRLGGLGVPRGLGIGRWAARARTFLQGVRAARGRAEPVGPAGRPDLRHAGRRRDGVAAVRRPARRPAVRDAAPAGGAAPARGRAARRDTVVVYVQPLRGASSV